MNVREKLVELLTEAFFDYNHGKGDGYIPKNFADHLVDNGVTVQEWISVSSPPKKPGEYLCYFKYEPESPNVICQNTYYGSGRWMSEPDKVTYWAYLPRPPKGE